VRTVSLEEALQILSNWRACPCRVGLFGGTLDKVPSRPTGPLYTLGEPRGPQAPREVVLACEGRPEERLPLEGSCFRLADTRCGMLPKHASVAEGDRRVGLSLEASSLWLAVLEITTPDGSAFSLAAVRQHPPKRV
jgi:hypothetical protein